MAGQESLVSQSAAVSHVDGGLFQKAAGSIGFARLVRDGTEASHDSEWGAE
jgi:hypothetical protein